MSIPLVYIDSKNEIGSVSILRELGIDIAHGTLNQSHRVPLNELSFEHCANDSVTIICSTGMIFVDIRDSGDCWLRATLRPGDGALTIPSKIFRRILPGLAGVDNVVLEHSSASAISRFARFSTDADERLNCALPYHSTRELVCELCRDFFAAGWVTGTGGSISIRYGNRIYMTPSGVQKERISPDELFVVDIDGHILSTPGKKSHFTPKLSDCSPLFLHAFKQRNAGAVLHSHAYSCNLVTSLCEGESSFSISHQEMIKGISGHGYFDELVIPIIENTAHEHELANSLGDCISKHPKSCAVLVRRHGMYVWGRTWEEAKRHGECLHYLFDIALNMKRLGLNYKTPPIPVGVSIQNDCNGWERRSDKAGANAGLSKPYKHVVFDIEGTTTPITFVKDVLFPYARKHLAEFLDETAATQRTQNDVAGVRRLAQSEGRHLPGHEDVCEYIQDAFFADRKDTALKELQGHIWEAAYESGAIRSTVFADVPACFSRLVHAGIKISIYSSGSRSAQRLLFQHSDKGDLRGFISCYFDTKIGNKRDVDSYREIALSLGVDSPDQILFVTDILEEALAAKEAGIHSILSSRPGNAQLPSSTFKVITSFDEL